MQIQEKINKLRAEIVRAEKEIEQLKRITDRFPDATVYQDRWKTERIFSATASPLCDKYDWKHSCGCCADSPVHLFPYLETEFGKVYANGAPFRVLDRDEWGFGRYLNNGFDVSNLNVSDDMKRQIQEFINRMAERDVPKD